MTQGAQHGAEKNFQFNVINFVDVSHSRRVNPIQRKYIPNLTDLLGFCRYKGRKHPQIQRRRMMEYLLLFEP